MTTPTQESSEAVKTTEETLRLRFKVNRCFPSKQNSNSNSSSNDKSESNDSPDPSDLPGETVLGPKSIPRSKTIKDVKQEYFPNDLKKGRRIRFFYCGRYLDKEHESIGGEYCKVTTGGFVHVFITEAMMMNQQSTDSGAGVKENNNLNSNFNTQQQTIVGIPTVTQSDSNDTVFQGVPQQSALVGSHHLTPEELASIREALGEAEANIVLYQQGGSETGPNGDNASMNTLINTNGFRMFYATGPMANMANSNVTGSVQQQLGRNSTNGSAPNPLASNFFFRRLLGWQPVATQSQSRPESPELQSVTVERVPGESTNTNRTQEEIRREADRNRYLETGPSSGPGGQSNNSRPGPTVLFPPNVQVIGSTNASNFNSAAARDNPNANPNPFANRPPHFPGLFAPGPGFGGPGGRFPDNMEIPEACRQGMHRDLQVIWPTIPGLLCGLCFYPWGLFCCFLHKMRRCPHCGYVAHSF